MDRVVYFYDTLIWQRQRKVLGCWAAVANILEKLKKVARKNIRLKSDIIFLCLNLFSTYDTLFACKFRPWFCNLTYFFIYSEKTWHMAPLIFFVAFLIFVNTNICTNVPADPIWPPFRSSSQCDTESDYYDHSNDHYSGSWDVV